MTKEKLNMLNYKVSFKGNFCYFNDLNEELKKKKKDFKKISSILKKNLFNFGLIVETDCYFFAATDRINSFPIFYNQNKKKINFFTKKCLDKDDQPNKDYIDEFMCAGYNCNDRTIFKNIKKLQSGQYIFLVKKTKKEKKGFYYSFLPNYRTKEKSTKETKRIFNKVFERLDNQIKDNPVCLFLSAGLDSRLIACKLHEMGKKNLTFISYGIANNFESDEAKKVSKVLGVSWRHINISAKKSRVLFKSNLIKKYWEFGDNFSSFLSLREFFVLHEMKERKIIPNNAIIMNGQSGDFLTGGHTQIISKEKKVLSIKDLYNIIINKHFTLNKQNLTIKVKKMILEDIKIWTKELKLKNNKDNLIKFYEFWEWIERQTKYVTQGIRAYEFYDYKWFMPLWDFELMDFWQKIPLNQKNQQKLYIDYLKDYNYKNLFKNYQRRQSQFPVQFKWLILLGNLIHFFSGKDRKESFYKIAQYFGQYNHQYKVYSLIEFIEKYETVKNPLSLFLNTWKERRLD